MLYRVQLSFWAVKILLGSYWLSSGMPSKTAFSSPLNRKKDQLLKTLYQETPKKASYRHF
jgi:hypothetical protein